MIFYRYIVKFDAHFTIVSVIKCLFRLFINIYFAIPVPENKINRRCNNSPGVIPQVQGLIQTMSPL